MKAQTPHTECLSDGQSLGKVRVCSKGEVWQNLKARQPGVDFLRAMGSVERLRDQLEGMRAR